MNDQITCPFCNKSFPVTEALKHQIRDEVKNNFEREQKQIMWKKALEMAEDRIKEKSTQDMKFLKDQLEEKSKKLEEANENEIQLRKDRVKLEEEKKEIELKTQRRIDEERNKIAKDSYEKAQEENRLKNREYEKKEQDMLKQIEEWKSKAQLGSQQLQGEVMELELEKNLKKEFPYDEIKEVPKGVRGADIIQVVKNNYGKACGIIVWESKRTKAWSDGWIVKLRDDQRQVKADLAVIVSNVLPVGIKTFGLKDNIWVSDYHSIAGLATALRASLLELAAVKTAGIGKEEKKEILWNYLTSIEFRQRIEAIYDAYSQMMEDLKKEKDWFTKKWAKQEKNIQKIADHILGMHGDLEGIVGKSLPEISGLEMLPEGKELPKKPDKNSLF